MNLHALPIIETSLLGLLILSWIIQNLFYITRVAPLAFFKKNEGALKEHPPVSVIICAKNEANNLRKFLPSILNQKYKDFEVVVVNDCSEDETELVLAELKLEFPHLYYTNIPLDRKFSHGKKLAVSLGIKAAKHEHMVFTDADCKAESNLWLQEMMEGFTNPSKEIVLGFGGYEKRKGFTNLLVRYDTFFAAIQYLGYALSGKPYMGVGRNLAYKKSLFNKNNGLQSHMHIASGDDDLFISETANKKNTAVVIHPEAHTTSVPPVSLRKWKDQKSRHLTTATHHKKSIQFSLILEICSRLILLSVGIYLILINTFVIIAALAIASKFTIQLLLWRKSAKQLDQGKLYWSVLIFDWLHPIMLLWAYLANTRRNKKQWK